MSALSLGGTLLVSASLYLYLSPKLPTVETLKEVKLQIPLRIYSQNSQLIGEFGEKRRTPISFEDIPATFIQALLSAEDDSFYSHNGVDFKGLLRAASQLVVSGEIQSGGSTITMQVARNFFLSSTQTFTRKFNEILLSLRIEEELTKEEILTLYANKIYLGNRAYGVEAAAQVYYGKSIKQLNTAQLAMIAGLPKAPSAYNPIANPERALIRRNWILKRMHHLGYLTPEQFQLAVNQPVSASYHGYKTDLYAPYIAEMARREILDKFGSQAYTDGYQVFTTVDSVLQATAQQAIQSGVTNYDTRHGYRGPEQRIANTEKWQEVLRQTSSIDNLRPAIVSGVTAQSLDIVFAGNATGVVNWENGLKGLRMYRTQNSRSAPIESTEGHFKPGDLIRVTAATDGSWKIAQLPQAQAAIVALNPDDGAIRALVGGFNFSQSNFNRATQAERQPGSNFKPFIYTTALENGFTAASIINDAPVVFQDNLLESYWRPENDSGKFYGPTRLRKALYLSRNMVSIRLLRALGVNRAIDGLERFGFDAASLPRDLSLVLGSYATTPLKIATGYAVLANGGFKVEPYLISHITDKDGNVLFRATPLTVCRDCKKKAEPLEDLATQENNDSLGLALDDLATELALEEPAVKNSPSTTAPIKKSHSIPSIDLPAAPRVVDERAAFIIDDILKDVIKKGTGKKALVLKRADIAGKTGTTNGPRDAWFSGYSPHIVATAWLGYDENRSLGRNEYGGSAALPIWIDFMATALKGKPEVIRLQPEGLVTVKINPTTGTRANPSDPNAIFEIFRKEDVPELSKDAPDSGGSKRNNSVLPEDIF
ncbi:MAG: penicillin-binding protein 1A [Pseudomonadales bacterium]|nr:penicillin-binding protein 1A [Pseudomonadales bacterium]MCP5301776.1 penicillin-binding protein 1A [Pseudomonadales bacterium]